MQSVGVKDTFVTIRKGPMVPGFLILVFTVLAVCNGCISVVSAENSLDTVQAAEDIMSDPSHSSKADPDYPVVFPDDQVNTLTITISPENWQTMLENMTELYGEFGGTAGGASPGQAAGNRDEGQAMGGMFSSVDPVYVPAEVSFDGLSWENVGIRFKGFNSLQGSWSEGSYKISLKLNFDKYEDQYPEIKNQRFYGFDELNLQGAYNDDSLIRDMIVPTIFRESGVPAPYTAFYRVYVDTGQGPVYFGLYTMVESVEDTVIETQFADDSGNLYKPEGNGATFAEGTFDTGCFEKKTNEKDADYSDVEELYEILNSDTRLSNPEEWRSELEAVFDVDEFLRWLATNTVIQNWDTYGGNCRNFYLYTDPTDGKITWIPWDNNYALSSGMNGGNQDGIPQNRTPWGDAPNMTDPRMPFPASDSSGSTGFDQNAVLASFQSSQSSGPSGFDQNAVLASFQSSQSSVSSGFDGSAALASFRSSGTNGIAGSGGAGTVSLPVNASGPGSQAPGNQTPGGMNMVGGMGSTLSLSLDEAGDNWPLIRFLADDPVYYAKYQGYLGMVATTSFEPSAMEEKYRYYHALIEPYVTGLEGEQDPYTHLDAPGDFDTALDELIDHVNSRYDAVMEFLGGTPVPTLTVTPTRTPAAATPTPTVAVKKDMISPVVKIISPASTISVAPGESLDIAWKATDSGGIAGVLLEYSGDGRDWTEITDSLPAEGAYTWIIPEGAGTRLSVRVTATDSSGNKGSAVRVCFVDSAGSSLSTSIGDRSSAGSSREELLQRIGITRSATSQVQFRAEVLSNVAGGDNSAPGPSGAGLPGTISHSRQDSAESVRSAVFAAISTGEALFLL